TTGSREYQVLLRWLQAGAPGPNAQDPSVTRLEVLPGPRTLRVSQEQPLLVRAEYSDSEWRDVTWLTKLESNDPGLIDATPTGMARVLRQGETAIRASFQGLVAVVVLTAPFDRPLKPESIPARNNFIDEHVFNKLAVLRIEPSELCDDSAFIRRVFLDAI